MSSLLSCCALTWAGCGNVTSPPPPGGFASPEIASLYWRPAAPLPSHLPPQPGDYVSITCTARDADGDAVTVTLTQTSGEGCVTMASPATAACTRQVVAGFAPGVAAEGAVLAATYVTVLGVNTRATLTCVATDDGGRRSAPKETCIPVSYPAGAVTCP